MNPANADPKLRASPLVWKERPIFISSTFRDMHAERDYLRGNGFLRLAEQLRERCHYLDTIDLRQGVETVSEADEAKREMQVLKVCLDEINRCKPFLVGLLGERYGHIPPADRITAAARDAGLPVSVEVAGKSVTELEILYAVLENPDQKKRSWFYFRTLDRTGMLPEVSAKFPTEEPSTDPTSPAGLLMALKDRIRRELPGRVREYTLKWDPATKSLVGLKELDDRIAQDLWSDLEAETAAFLRAAPKTWQEADARAVADFVAERIRGYVDRPAVTEPMVAHALSPAAGGTDSVPSDVPWGLVVIGESGSGKSSLFGRVYEAARPRAEAGEIVLLSHAAGIFPMSGQVDRMLKRWVTELAEFLGVPDPLEPAAKEAQSPGSTPPATAGRDTFLGSSVAGLGEAGEWSGGAGAGVVTAEQIDKTFASLLGRAAAKRRVILLVDALNQFEPTVRAEYLTWLPKLWPENARFVATAIPGKATAALLERKGCRERAVPPVSREEAAEIARRFYRERHHRAVNPTVVAALVDKNTAREQPAHGNPLWLALALQEMNLLEADDYERAEREYARLPGAERMQALQLDEAKKLPANVPGVYGELLARAERGFGKAWADAFVDLIAVSRAGWRESDLRLLMPVVSGQPWDDLAFAGVRRVLGVHVVQRGAQAQWDFFHAALRDTVLCRDLADEATCRRLHGLLADHLESLPPADPLRIGETMVHLSGLGDRDRAADYLALNQPLKWSYSNARAALAAAVGVLVTALQSAVDAAAREWLTDWIAGLMGGDDNPRAGRVANVVIFDLNDSLAVTGEVRTEIPRARLLLAAQFALSRLAAADPSNTSWQRDLSVSHNKIGDVLRAQGDLVGALKAYRDDMAIIARLAAADPSNADWQWGLSVSHIKIGDVLLDQGDLAGALKAYREDMAITARLATAVLSNAGCQRDLSVSQARIGDVLRAQGDLAGALKIFRESLAVRARLAAADPSNAGWQRDLSVSHNEIGDVLRAQGDLVGALQAYRETQAILAHLAAADPSNAGWQRDLSVSKNRIGDVLLDQGDLAGALQAYRETQTILAHLAAADPSNAGWQRDLSLSQENIGDVLLDQGDLAGALKAYRETQTILARLAAADPSNAGWQRDLSVSHNKIGDVLLDQGDLAGALKAYREDMAIIARLAAADPSNAGWQRDLSVSHIKIGDVLRAQGDLTGALKAYRETQTILARLATADPSNAGWQRDLTVSHNKIGDVLLDQGDLAGSLKAYREDMAITARLAVADPSNAGWQRDLSVSHIKIGDVLRAQGDLAGALKAYRETQTILARLATADPSNAGWQRDLTVSHNKIGDVLLDQGDLVGALKAYREDMAITARLAAADPSNAGWQRDLSVSHIKIGEVLRVQGDLAGALQAYREYQAGMQHLAAADPSNAGWQRDLTVSQEKIGDMLRAQGDLAGALKIFRESLAVRVRLAAADPSNAGWQRDLASAYCSVGMVLQAQGDLAGAIEHAKSFHVVATELVTRNPDNPEFRLLAMQANGFSLRIHLSRFPVRMVMIGLALGLGFTGWKLVQVSHWFWFLSAPIFLLALVPLLFVAVSVFAKTRAVCRFMLSRQGRIEAAAKRMIMPG